MSDSAHVGDAARLEAALERIVEALGRATPHLAPPDAALADAPTPEHDAPAEAAAPDIDVAAIGARLDGLIAELRDVLGEDAALSDPPSHP